jgi:hypothetical protein
MSKSLSLIFTFALLLSPSVFAGKQRPGLPPEKPGACEPDLGKIFTKEQEKISIKYAQKFVKIKKLGVATTSVNPRLAGASLNQALFPKAEAIKSLILTIAFDQYSSGIAGQIPHDHFVTLYFGVDGKVYVTDGTQDELPAQIARSMKSVTYTLTDEEAKAMRID